VTPPESFSAGGATQVDRWWEEFGDAGLTGLIDSALQGNLSLQAAWARLDRARAVARQAGADLLPQVSARANASRTRSVVEGFFPPGDYVDRRNQYLLALGVDYEVDLWRRIRTQADAAAAEARATRQDVEAAAVSLAAAVGQTWFALAEQMAQQDLLAEQFKVSQTFLDLAELRFGQGQGSALDVYQQRTQLAAVRGQIPLVTAQIAVLKHQLAALAGQTPRSETPQPAAALPQMPDLPATGLPAELLQRRPDVQAAYSRLAAADGRTAVAAAALLPSLRLGGRAGYQWGELHDLFENGMWSIAGGLTAPIFQGGRLRADVDRARAEAMQRLREYEQTMLTAFREVEDALVQEEQQRAFLSSLQEQVQLSEATLEQAQLRYKNGLNDYLPVLTALQSLQELQRQRLTARRELIRFRIRLYEALGGSWPAVMKRMAAKVVR